MQLKPQEQFAVVRQLSDPFDSGTYYVQAKIRNAHDDTLLATLNLSDKGGQRFRSDWQVPADTSGEGFYIDIETIVYTDSGYSTVSDVYGRENAVYLVQDRATPPFGAGGGPDIDYKRLGNMLRGILKEQEPVKVPRPQKVDLTGTEERILGAVNDVLSAVQGIEVPNHTEAIERLAQASVDAKNAILGAIDAKPVTEKTDVGPVIDAVRKEGNTIREALAKLFEPISKASATMESVAGKVAESVNGMIQKINKVPFLTIAKPEDMEAEPIPEIEANDPGLVVPPRRRRIPTATRGFVSIALIAFIGAAALAGTVAGTIFYMQPQGADTSAPLGDTVSTLPQFTSTTSPSSAITQRSYGKDVRLTGLESLDCIGTDANGILGAGTCTGGGGSGTVGTSSQETAGHISYWTTTNGFPALLGSVATGTLSVPTGLTVTSNRYVIGGNAAIALDTGYVIPLQSTLDAKALGATTLTIAGTANQLTSSAGAQDISTNRTWTLSLPNHVIFPGNFRAGNSTTTNATTTAMDITSILTFGGVTGNSWDDFCVSITGSADLCDGSDDGGAGGDGYAPDFSYNQDIGFGVTGSATSTKTQFTAGIHASGTSQFSNASTTLATVVTGWFTNIFVGADTLAEYIADTAGAFFTGNTETGITVTYQDADNTVDVVCNTADTSTFGCLTGTDWNTFNAKESALTFNWPLVRSVNAVSWNATTTPWAANQFVYTNAAGLLVSAASSSLAIPNAGLANSTISGIALGSNLADLTATNGTLTFSGTYNGGTARTIGLNLANANTWTALQQFSNATSTLFSTTYASSTSWFGGGLTSCSNGTTDKVLYNSTTGQFSCGTDQGGAGGTPGGSGTELQYRDGASFGGIANSAWNSAGYLGIGSTTPFALLSVASSTWPSNGRPLFQVATSTGYPLLTIRATSTTNGGPIIPSSDNGARVVIGADDANAKSTLYVNGPISSSWTYTACEESPFFQVAISADTNNICGKIAFDEVTNATLTAVALNAGGHFGPTGMSVNLSSASTADTGSLYLSHQNYRRATSTPILEGVVGAANTGTATTTTRFFGFGNNTGGPAVGQSCGFIASSTISNWRAECFNSTMQILETSVATTTVIVRMRIEFVSGTQANFYIKDSLTGPMTYVGSITHTIPETTALYPVFQVIRATGGTAAAPAWSLYSFRFWQKDIMQTVQ